MIKPFYSSLPFLFVLSSCVCFPFCNDHQSFWCEQIWELLVITVTTGMLQLDGHGLMLDSCCESPLLYCNLLLYEQTFGHPLNLLILFMISWCAQSLFQFIHG